MPIPIRFCVVEPTVTSRELVRSLARFDVGIVYVDEGFGPIRDTMRPNKLYEYLAAGLPVVANRGRELEQYLREKEAGFVFEGLDEAVHGDQERGGSEQAGRGWPPPVETYESQASRLDAFFEEVLAGSRAIPG